MDTLLLPFWLAFFGYLGCLKDPGKRKIDQNLWFCRGTLFDPEPSRRCPGRCSGPSWMAGGRDENQRRRGGVLDPYKQDPAGQTLVILFLLASFWFLVLFLFVAFCGLEWMAEGGRMLF